MTKSGWASFVVLLAGTFAGCGGKTVIGLVVDAGRVGCGTSADCGRGEFCWGEVCSSKLLFGHCGDSSEHRAAEVCQTGICLGGSCCATSCATSDPLCGAAACEATNGACQYAATSVSCGPAESCVGGSHTGPSSCDGLGACALAAPKACDSLACASDGKTCHSGCKDDSSCLSTQYCAAGKCAPRLAAGSTCSGSSACATGLCLGSSCCAAACDTTDAQCGAASCDGTGACVYPGAQSSCSAGNDPTLSNCSGTCNSAGGCTPKTCPSNFGCGGTADCKTACTTNADCSGLAFCDPAGASACCGKFSADDTIYIDGSAGTDANPCCGTLAAPCQTISHAMTLVAGSATSGVVLSVSNTSGSTTWTPNEVYPIHLGWGVTLTAQSLYFVNPTVASDVFDVYAYDAADTGTVTIQGANSDVAHHGLVIGFDPGLDPDGDNWIDDWLAAYCHCIVAVNDEVPGTTSLPMVLSGVWLNSMQNFQVGYALRVGAGASVTLGPNPVEIGNGGQIGSHTRWVYGDHGIHCQGAGAAIQDDPAATAPVLTVDGQMDSALTAEDGCTVSLTRGPQLGWFTSPAYPAVWDGTLASCQAMPEQDECQQYCELTTTVAVQVVGSGKVTFGSADMPGEVRCAKYAFDAETSNASGSPTILLNHAIVDLASFTYCMGGLNPCTGDGCCRGGGFGCAGAMVTEGTLSATQTTFEHSFVGVFVGGNAAGVDLSGGGSGGNTFVCNGVIWGGNMYWPGTDYCGASAAVLPVDGADLVNATANLSVNAQNAIWGDWDAAANATQAWTCTDTTYANCTCNGPNCGNFTSPGASPDGADTIYLSTNTAAIPIDSRGGSLQPNSIYCPFPQQ